MFRRACSTEDTLHCSGGLAALRTPSIVQEGLEHCSPHPPLFRRAWSIAVLTLHCSGGLAALQSSPFIVQEGLQHCSPHPSLFRRACSTEDTLHCSGGLAALQSSPFIVQEGLQSSPFIVQEGLQSSPFIVQEGLQSSPFIVQEGLQSLPFFLFCVRCDDHAKSSGRWLLGSPPSAVVRQLAPRAWCPLQCLLSKTVGVLSSRCGQV